VLRAGDQPGVAQHVEVLHHRGEFDRERLGDSADRQAVLLLEARQDRPPGRVHKRCEDTVEISTFIVHHMVNY